MIKLLFELHFFKFGFILESDYWRKLWEKLYKAKLYKLYKINYIKHKHLAHQDVAYLNYELRFQDKSFHSCLS